jgi:hypothetical protein
VTRQNRERNRDRLFLLRAAQYDEKSFKKTLEGLDTDG